MTDLKSKPEPSHSDSPAIPGIEQRVLYHGTSRQAARRILQEGLRNWTWTADTLFARHLAKQGIPRPHDCAPRGKYPTS